MAIATTAALVRLEGDTVTEARVVVGGALLLAAHLAWFKPFSIDVFFDREFARFGLEQPELLSMLGVLDATPFDFYNDELTDVSLAQRERVLTQARGSLETLRSYDRSALSRDQQLTYDVYEWFLRDAVDN